MSTFEVSPFIHVLVFLGSFVFVSPALHQKLEC